MITQSELKELLHYNPETGVFTWVKTRGGAKNMRQAGYVAKDGYIVIGIKYSQRMAHVLAWLYVYGEWPKHEIDHKDGNPANNAIGNLRLATRSQNLFNTKIRKHSTTGFKGVERAGKGFQARIRSNGIRYCLGTYATPEEAFAVRNAKAKELHENFSRSE